MKFGTPMSLAANVMALVLLSQMRGADAVSPSQCSIFQLKYMFGFPYTSFDFLGEIRFAGFGTAVPFRSSNCMMALPVKNTWKPRNSNQVTTGYESKHWIVVASDSGGETCYEIISTYASASTPANSQGMSAWFMNHLTTNYLAGEAPHPQYPTNDNPYICIGTRRTLLRGGGGNATDIDNDNEDGVHVMKMNMTKVMDVSDVSELLETIEETRTDDEMKENGPLSKMKAEELEMWLRVHG